MRPIIKAPRDVLSIPAKPVTHFDKQLSSLINAMKKTLMATKNPKGVGLAAPQIGEPYRIFITKPEETAIVSVFINPEIISTSGTASDKDSKNLEGCLSVPDIWGKTKRSKTLKLKYQDEHGQVHEETFTDFMATIIQHEIDHLNGILFTQRVLEQKGKLYQVVKNKEGKEELQEIRV